MRATQAALDAGVWFPRILEAFVDARLGIDRSPEGQTDHAKLRRWLGWTVDHFWQERQDASIEDVVRALRDVHDEYAEYAEPEPEPDPEPTPAVEEKPGPEPDAAGAFPIRARDGSVLDTAAPDLWFGAANKVYSATPKPSLPDWVRHNLPTLDAIEAARPNLARYAATNRKLWGRALEQETA